MERYFDEHYDLLKSRLHAMADLVRGVIAETVEALSSGTEALAHEVIEADEEIDRAEVELDELIMKLLALHQPMAVDLRFLVTSLKINNDLERRGEQAVNIAQGVLLLASRNENGQLVDFRRMEEMVLGMVRDCLEAFTRSDAELARRVCEKDHEVDEMNHGIIRSLSLHSHEHPEDADRCISLILICRNLERIGDLSTNIAEDAVYYIEGKIIKHAHG